MEHLQENCDKLTPAACIILRYEDFRLYRKTLIKDMFNFVGLPVPSDNEIYAYKFRVLEE